MSSYHRVRFFETQTLKSLLLLILSQLKNFLTQWIKNWIRSLRTKKIISESCELVKLCHVKRSGPVFLKHSVYQPYFIIIIYLFFSNSCISNTNWGLWNCPIDEHFKLTLWVGRNVTDDRHRRTAHAIRRT